MTYYTIDVNADRKPVNGWEDVTVKLHGSDELIMEKCVAVTLADKYAAKHQNDGVRVLEHIVATTVVW